MKVIEVCYGNIINVSPLLANRLANCGAVIEGQGHQKGVGTVLIFQKSFFH